MFQRCVLTFLLVGYLAGQLAAVPHTHEHEHDSEHGGRAHAHIGWLVPTGNLAANDHTNDHRHGDSHNSPLPAESGESEHDSDLMYLPDAEVANIGKAASLDAPFDGAISPAICSCDCPKVAIRKADLRSVPPAEAFAGCDLFLKLRTLRI